MITDPISLIAISSIVFAGGVFTYFSAYAASFLVVPRTPDTCSACGYPLAGLRPIARCPECGARVSRRCGFLPNRLWSPSRLFLSAMFVFIPPLGMVLHLWTPTRGAPLNEVLLFGGFVVGVGAMSAVPTIALVAGLRRFRATIVVVYVLAGVGFWVGLPLPRMFGRYLWPLLEVAIASVLQIIMAMIACGLLIALRKSSRTLRNAVNHARDPNT